MAMEWFCIIRGKQVGPLRARDLKIMALTGKLKPNDCVKNNNSAWVLACNVSGLKFAVPESEDAEPKDTEPKQDHLPETVEVGSSSVRKADAARTTPAPDSNSDNAPDANSQNDVTSEWTPGGSSAFGANVDNASIFSDESEEDSRTSMGSVTRIVRELGPGSILGNYQVLEKIGEGGMGTVLKAQHMRMERFVAIKVLRTHSTEEEGAINRFQQEVKAAAKLSNPNIVTAYDADEVNGLHFLIMEYVDGKSLAELLIHAKNGLPLDDVTNYMLQSARGLAYAHAQKLVHRDVKPSNILLDTEGVIKVLDFGLATVVEKRNTMARKRQVTSADTLLGTFDYMAPEQAEDASGVDYRADIYSLGCTFFHLATGHPPFTGNTALEKIFAHRDHDVPSLSDHIEVSHDLDAVCRKMMAKNPQDRYANTDEVVADLEACMSGTPIDAWKSGKWAPGDSALGSGGQVVVNATDDEDEDSITLSPLEGENDKPPQKYIWLMMNEELGPFTAEELRGQSITKMDRVRKEEDNIWMDAWEIEGLFN